MEQKKKLRLLMVSVLLFFMVVFGFLFYEAIQFTHKPLFFTKNREMIYITPEDDFTSVLQKLEPYTTKTALSWFKQLALWKKYDKYVKTGRYDIDHCSVAELLRILLQGRQTPLRLIFNNMRLKEDLAGRIAAQLMLDSMQLITLLNDSAVCAKMGFTTETVSTMFIPNTYEVYWNVSDSVLLQRIYKEYHSFWNTKRLSLADSIGLTPVEVSILASIVEEETALPEERSIVAGLYLNRLRRKMLLQADPTVKFAMKDFQLRRILTEHLSVDSPYNTYLYPGLPPGPIRIPSIGVIDAVLCYNKHDYLYMCAKEDFSGRHNFAKTLGEHNRNAVKYQRALNQRKIFK